MENKYLELMEEAKKASKNAYCPYSKFSVGACILYESGQKYVGCNVENASYGLALCAERNAISNAIAQGENSKIIAVAIYSPNQIKCMPCGACRQWFNEFSNDLKVVLEDENNSLLILSLEEIFPYGFKLEN